MKKSKMIIALVMLVLIMGVGYAAFSTRITITTSATGAGGISVKYKCSCTAVTGLTGATAPTGSCTPTTEGTATTATMTATLRQPGDSVTCTWTVKNYSAFRVKTTGLSCTHTNVKSPFTSSNTAVGATTLAVNGTTTFTVTIGYLSSITSQPSTTTSGQVTCTIPWAQIA